jgi:AbrB family looped-hinge helix DNA binding protein
MAGTKGKGGCCDASTCCRVDSILAVDERGQMVLPKDLRERAGIKAGDKLAVATWEEGGKVCCIILMPSDSLVGLLKEKLGPLAKDLGV